ncbi:MAG: hypothetical protein ACYS6K_15840 [Planctomycetota bacterium]
MPYRHHRKYTGGIDGANFENITHLSNAISEDVHKGYQITSIARYGTRGIGLAYPGV